MKLKSISFNDCVKNYEVELQNVMLIFLKSNVKLSTGAPNVNFPKISVNSEDDFRNIFCKIYCLPASPRIFEHLKHGIIANF